MKKIALIVALTMGLSVSAQKVMTPELLWKLGRVSVLGISKDKKSVVYKVSTPSVQDNKSNSKYYTVPVIGGNPTEIKEIASLG